MGEQVDQIIDKLTGGAGAGTTETSGTDGVNGQMLFCDAKSEEQLNEFVDREKPKLVALVGFANYGKSTFIGTLYQLLIKNLTYQGYRFVDSDTYVGFERRIFLRRHNEGDVSDTKRNILGENDVLSLTLQTEKGIKHQVIVSDKSGETYSKYTSSDEEIEKDVVIENADLVIFFVDAEADSLSLAQHNLIAEKYESLLSRLRNLKKIGPETKYMIVFSKADKVVGEERKKKFHDRQEKLRATFAESIGTHAQGVYVVDSKTLTNEPLNEVFSVILTPKESMESMKETDWVKAEIEKMR